MVGKGIEVGVAYATPLRSVLDQNYFLDALTHEMVEWYYWDDNVSSVSFEPLDDRTALIHIIRMVDNKIQSKTMTIGESQKRQIYRSYRFYHPT